MLAVTRYHANPLDDRSAGVRQSQTVPECPVKDALFSVAVLGMPGLQPGLHLKGVSRHHAQSR